MTQLQKLGIEIKEGMHDFDILESMLFIGAETASTGVFKWVTRSSGNGLKRSGSIVRVKGGNLEKINNVAEDVRSLLDDDDWDGRKSVVIKK